MYVFRNFVLKHKVACAKKIEKVKELGVKFSKTLAVDKSTTIDQLIEEEDSGGIYRIRSWTSEIYIEFRENTGNVFSANSI